jgi:hypothetical protein
VSNLPSEPHSVPLNMVRAHDDAERKMKALERRALLNMELYKRCRRP